MESAFTFKVQLGDKIKMLAGNSFATIEELRKACKASYPKRLGDKEINLKYADEDGDWLYLSEDDDLEALRQHAASLKGKKIKLVIDVTQNNEAEDVNVERVRKAFASASLEDNKEEVKYEDLRDFKLADVATEIESLLNSEERVRPGQLFKAFRKATEGTKAEPHIKRFMGKMRKHGGGKHGFKKMMKRCHEARSCSQDKSSSPEGCPVFSGQGVGECGPFGAFGGFGPMSHPFSHGPHFGPHGGFGQGHHGDRRAMKFFRKFMKSYRSSSSSSFSSEERKKKRQEKRAQRMGEKNEKKQEHKKKRPIITQQPTEAITGKAGETVNVSKNSCTLKILFHYPHCSLLRSTSHLKMDLHGHSGSLVSEKSQATKL